MSIWLPQDNKFVTEITMKIEASKFQLRKIEHEKTRAEDKIGLVESQIIILDDSFDFLRSKTAIIVSSREWKNMKTVYSKLMAEKASLLKSINQYSLALQQLENEIATLKKEIESVKFKVLPFRRKK